MINQSTGLLYYFRLWLNPLIQLIISPFFSEPNYSDSKGISTIFLALIFLKFVFYILHDIINKRKVRI